MTDKSKFINDIADQFNALADAFRVSIKPVSFTWLVNPGPQFKTILAQETIYSNSFCDAAALSASGAKAPNTATLDQQFCAACQAANTDIIDIATKATELRDGTTVDPRITVLCQEAADILNLIAKDRAGSAVEILLENFKDEVLIYAASAAVLDPAPAPVFAPAPVSTFASASAPVRAPAPTQAVVFFDKDMLGIYTSMESIYNAI